MPLVRIQIDSDRGTARKVVGRHRAGKIHHDSREAARAEVQRLGHTPAGDPVFIGVSNGEPVRLIYEIPVYLNQ